MTLATIRNNERIGFTTSYGSSNPFVVPNCTIQASNNLLMANLPSVLNAAGFLYNSFRLHFISYGNTSLTQEFIENLNRLEDIGKLEDNWNGNGAPAFPAKQIELMRNIISILHVQPFITPTANKSIQFEFENDAGNYLEFELFSDERVKMFIYFSNGETNTEYISIEKVSEMVDDFYRRTVNG